MRKWDRLCRCRVETRGVADAREALARVEADAPQVEAIRVDNEARLRRNGFGPMLAAALRLRRFR